MLLVRRTGVFFTPMGMGRDEAGLVQDATAPLAVVRHVPGRVLRAGHSAVGSVRSHNEDAFSLAPAGAPEARYGTLCVLADGVGGRPGGAAASRYAVGYLQALYYAETGLPLPGDRLRACVEAVNLLSRSALRWTDRPGAGEASSSEALTTLVAAVAFNDRLWVANVGDSRAYLIHAQTGRCQRLTEDHSQAAALGAEPGDTQPLARPVSRAITRAIGLDEQTQVDIYTYTWAVGDRLILCSDGLSALPERSMVELALSLPPEAAATRLVEEAVRLDGSDNATAVVMSWEQAAARRAPARRAPRRIEPAWSTLGLITGVAVFVGMALGWLSAALLYMLMNGGPGLP